MLEKTIAWRKEFRPFAITLADIHDIMGLGTVFVAGTDRKQRPVVYMRPGGDNPFQADKRVKLIVYMLEETSRRGYESLTWIVDFARLGGKDQQSPETRKQVMHVLQNYYPERLGSLLMVNTPWYIGLVARLMWPFIDPKTREKIKLGVSVKKLVEYVNEEDLIQDLGGLKEVRLDALQPDELFPPPIPRQKF
jgi:hypothetical protein